LKGGAGFGRIIRPDLMVLHGYDGNRTSKSLGNIGSNDHVRLLFIRLVERF
jgi:hypothetical protein